MADAALGAGTVLAALAGYQLLLRPQHLALGATEQEAGEALPGDDLLPAPSVVSTRAITIDAPPERVWPWLVQLGKDRGGLYSYTVFENAFGLGIHNADRIVPELQQLAVGDRVPLSKNRFALLVRHLDAPHSLVFQLPPVGQSDERDPEGCLRPQPDLHRQHWPAQIASGDTMQEIAKLKTEPGKDIVACGGTTFMHALIKLGVADEYRLWVLPAVTGKGAPLFPELDHAVNLHLVSSRAFPSGILELVYTPADT